MGRNPLLPPSDPQPEGLGVGGAGDGEAVEALHGGQGGREGLGGALGVGPQVPGGEVAILLQPRLGGAEGFGGKVVDTTGDVLLPPSPAPKLAAGN